MKLRNLNESFKSFGITEDVDEFNDYNNDYDLPLKNVDRFESVYLATADISDYDSIGNFIYDMAGYCDIIEGTPDVLYLSNGDPGSPGEPDSAELPPDKIWNPAWENCKNYTFEEWLDELLNDTEVATDELINNIETYVDTLKELFESEVMPSEELIEEKVIEDAIENYHDYKDSYWD